MEWLRYNLDRAITDVLPIEEESARLTPPKLREAAFDYPKCSTPSCLSPSSADWLMATESATATSSNMTSRTSSKGLKSTDQSWPNVSTKSCDVLNSCIFSSGGTSFGEICTPASGFVSDNACLVVACSLSTCWKSSQFQGRSKANTALPDAVDGVSFMRSAQENGTNIIVEGANVRTNSPICINVLILTGWWVEQLCLWPRAPLSSFRHCMIKRRRRGSDYSIMDSMLGMA